MADNKVIDISFQDEKKLLYEELNQNDILYKQLKAHFDKLLNSHYSGSLKFISDQTSNILGSKKDRVEIIKTLINIKKIEGDNKVKEAQFNKNEDGNSEQYKQLAMAVANVLADKPKDGTTISKLIENNKKQSKEEIDDIDKQLDMRLAETNEKEEKEEEKEKIDYKVVCDSKGNVYPVDEDYNLLDDVEVPSGYKIHFVLDEKDKSKHAYNEENKEIEIIEVEDE